MSKFALLMGINYIATPYRLYGCINDIIMMRKYLIEKRGYLDSNIIIMRDDDAFFISPTRANIITQLNNLIATANNNNASEIFFHYSGHGTNVRDNNKDEIDKKDEMLCPVDFSINGCIRDDDIRGILNNLNKNTVMLAVIDACNSGTSLDLPYLYSISNNKLTLKENNSKVYKSLLSKKIYSISGCRDDQTSADAYNVYSEYSDPSNAIFSILASNRAGGALTSTLLNLLNNTSLTFTNILPNLRVNLRKSYYEQVPELSSSVLLVNIKKNKKKNKRKVIIRRIKILKLKKKILNKSKKKVFNMISGRKIKMIKLNRK